MKFTLVFSLFLISTLAYSNEVKNFNKVLVESVKKDIRNDNAEELKATASRAPASVETEVENEIQEESKIDKNVRQLGTNKW